MSRGPNRNRVWLHGEMVGGRLDLDRSLLVALLRDLPDGPVKVLVTHERALSEHRQMEKFWHAVPVEISRRHFGLQHDPMHYTLLGEWRGYMEGPLGHEVPICSSSRKLSRPEWVELLDWVLDWGPSEHGLVIPPPQSPDAVQMTEQYHAATQGD